MEENIDRNRRSNLVVVPKMATHRKYPMLFSRLFLLVFKCPLTVNIVFFFFVDNNIHKGIFSESLQVIREDSEIITYETFSRWL